MNVMVTGGCGFIGSQVVRNLLALGHRVHSVDNLTYAAVGGSRLAELADQFRPAFTNWRVDVADRRRLRNVFDIVGPELVIHMAAETHVDRAIEDSGLFVQTNVAGTQVVLDCVREHMPVREDDKPVFCYVSTDEVYGPWKLLSIADKRKGFDEASLFNPRNPYAATKAAAEHLVMSYYHTYGLPVVITRGSNTFGLYQLPEKFLPLMICRALAGQKLPVYGDGCQTREWMHVRDHANGIVSACEKGVCGQAYNLGPGSHESNLDVVRAVLLYLQLPEALIEYVEDRPGHDRDYAIDPRKAEKTLGWKAGRKFISDDANEVSYLHQTIDWYRGHEGQEWCKSAGRNHLERKGLLCKKKT